MSAKFRWHCISVWSIVCHPWTRACLTGIETQLQSGKSVSLFLFSTNSKPDPYPGPKDHTDWESSKPR